MQEAIIKLKLLGQMPDAVKDDLTVETINMYDELLSNVKTPLTREEVGLSLIHIYISNISRIFAASSEFTTSFFVLIPSILIGSVWKP